MAEDSRKEIMDSETEERAELEAAADTVHEEKTEDINEVNSRFPYIIPLTKTYDLDGKKISELDLSGLEDLTTTDGEYIERVMAKMNHHPINKFADTTYAKHIAMRVTGLPVEFFNALKWKDMKHIIDRITVYFLY